MKRICALSVLFLVSISLNAQFTVTKVSGRIKTGDGDLVRPGSELNSNAHLYFSSLRDKIWVIQVGKGEKMISPTPQAIVENSLFSQMLLSALHVTSMSGSLSGRGQSTEQLPDVLQGDPGVASKVIIEERNQYLFDVSKYPQGNGRSFFLQINIPGQNPIVRRLKTNRDSVIIWLTDFLTESTDPSIQYKLGYFNPSSNPSSSEITSITPYFDQTNEMESVIATTILALDKEDKPVDTIRNHAYRAIYFSLGKPDYLLFTNLFNKLWQTRSMTVNNPSKSKGAIFNEREFESVPKLTSSASMSRAELPANFSLRQYAPPIGDQGQFGSCTAWATAYASRTITYAVRHNFSINNQYEKILSYTFSPDFIYNNIRLSGDCDHGTSIYAALQFMKQKGNLLRTDKGFVCGRTYPVDVLSDAKNYQIKDFSAVNTLRTEDKKLVYKMKGLLVSKNALPFAMHVTNSFERVDRSGIWYPSGADYANIDSVRRRLAPYDGHAMCVIGYNDSIAGGSFEIMNSWGTRYGNNGFYWINYDDFLRFVFDIYQMNDFDPVVEDEVIPKVDVPHLVTPVVVAPKVDIHKQIVVYRVYEKPKLKGSLEFMILEPDGSFENSPVAKKLVGERGQDVSLDADVPGSYADFVLQKPFLSGTRYKIKFSTSQPLYVYVFGMDNLRSYNLFPQKKLNESALISFTDATLTLPNDSSNYKLDNNPGKEKMCVLLSKSPIDVDALNQQFSVNGHNLYEAVRSHLSNRLMEMKSANYSSNKIEFNTDVKDADVLAFFIEMDHR